MGALIAWWHQLPIVTDPAFYLLAIPAVLMMGMSKSGFLSGLSTLAVPLLSVVSSVTQAAAIMLPLLLIMDGVGIQQLWQDRDRALLRLLLPAGLLGTLIGVASFGMLSPKAVAGVLGGTTLLFVAQRVLFPPRSDASAPPWPLGFVLGIVSGFTSFVAHAGGPPINAYVLPLRLPPVRFTATLAVFFAALNLTKWIPYGWLGLIDLRNMATSIVLMPVAPIGVWFGIWLARRIRPTWFYRVAYGSMFVAGVKLLCDGVA